MKIQMNDDYYFSDLNFKGGIMFNLFNGIISVYTKNLGILMELMTEVQDNLVTMYQNGADLYFFEVTRLNEVEMNYLRKHFEVAVVTECSGILPV